MDLKNIKSLIQFVSKSGVYEVEIKLGDTKVHIKNKVTVEQNAVLPSVQVLPSISQPLPALTEPPKEEKSEDGSESRYIIIKSPMIGTFYRCPAPDKELHVKVGDKIEPGTKLCVIEAMKLFNDIEAEVSGKIVKIFVEDASPVEYNQPLFLVDPNLS
ncbi:MAG: acetyl-CoA carboxylase biotin carboxyl carrier protein [Flavobacteriales bacterium AspAUS03]